MGKLVVNKGTSNFIADLEALTASTTGVLKQGLYNGASVAIDYVKSEIESLPSPITDEERNAMLNGVGISHMKVEDGNVSVTIGFDGYDGHPTKAYPKGRAVSMLVRAINSGTSWRTKRPFMNKARNKAKQPVSKAVKDTVEDTIQKMTK